MVGRLKKPSKKKPAEAETQAAPEAAAPEPEKAIFLKKLEEVEAKLDAIEQELAEMRSKL